MLGISSFRITSTSCLPDFLRETNLNLKTSHFLELLKWLSSDCSHFFNAIIGNYLGGQYSVAYDVIAKFFEGATNEKNIKKSPEEKHAESELILFQSRCLEKQNKFDNAITHLRAHQNRLVDVLSFRVKIAELMILSGRYAEASYLWDGLVREQGENYRYHSGLQTAALRLDADAAKQMFLLTKLELPSTTLPLSDVQKDILMELYRTKNYRSRANGKIMLTFSRGDQLRILIEEHIRKSLHDEVPALYQDILSLVRCSNALPVKDPSVFREHSIAIMVVEIVNRFVCNLKSHDSFEIKDLGSGTGSVPPGEREAPGVLLWGMFLQAHLKARCGDVSGALVVVEACLEHTPTALDVHTMKARLLKKSGDVQEASNVMDYCRSLGQ